MVTSKLEDQLDSQTNISESVVEEPLVVKVQKPGTTGRWQSIKDISIWNALLHKWKMLLQSLFPAVLKSMSISDNPHDHVDTS